VKRSAPSPLSSRPRREPRSPARPQALRTVRNVVGARPHVAIAHPRKVDQRDAGAWRRTDVFQGNRSRGGGIRRAREDGVRERGDTGMDARARRKRLESYNGEAERWPDCPRNA
jgi:hypothetical protein